MRNKILTLAIILAIISVSSVFSQVLLPSFISDNMVLQQQTEAPIWEKPILFQMCRSLAIGTM